MQITSALRKLVQAHGEDQSFPYLDYVGAFMLVEKWIVKSGAESLRRIEAATPDDLLGLPLGDTVDDLRLGYVLDLLRVHAQEVFDATSAPAERLLH